MAKIKKGSKKARCASCKMPLSGTMASSNWASKTKKRPSRPYGGFLCSPCTRTKILEALR